MNLYEAISNKLEDYLNGLFDDFLVELKAQGHIDTGRLAQSKKVTVKTGVARIIGELAMEDYVKYLETGTRPRRVTGAQVAALKAWWKRKGLTDKEAEGAAWGTAKNQVKYGSPTPASYAFSSNGRRKGVLTQAIDKSVSAIKSDLNFEQELDIYFNNLLTGAKSRQ